MGSYIPSTQAERAQMLAAIGLDTVEDLYQDVPGGMKVKKLDLPQGKSEMETRRYMEGLSEENKVFPVIFRGAGAYNHYIPSIVRGVTSKETFLTAYTPYQAEISQGILQSIFEFQTMICELTGMDVSNASVYDGASAAAEAAAMCRDKKRGKALVSAAAHPMVIRTVRTYCEAAGVPVELIPEKDGVTDREALASMLDAQTACVYIQQPNFYGLFEDAAAIGEQTHAAGAKYIMGVNPIACAVMKTPGECGADIAVGEGQPLGIPLGFGGPYLGFMASTSAMMRKLPGRIAGETTDLEGKRAYVLTLQAREQHIRREKASSNICSNQAFCALTASVYMAAMGAQGIREVARQCMSKAHYAAERICSVNGFARIHGGAFFHEFVTSCPLDPDVLTAKLADHGILGGYPVDGNLLWCVTEMNTKEQIDALAAVLEEVCGK